MDSYPILKKLKKTKNGGYRFLNNFKIFFLFSFFFWYLKIDNLLG
jgi:hypothetical protein